MVRGRIDNYNNLWWAIKENETLDSNTITTTLYAVEDLFSYETLFDQKVDIIHDSDITAFSKYNSDKYLLVTKNKLNMADGVDEYQWDGIPTTDDDDEDSPPTTKNYKIQNQNDALKETTRIVDRILAEAKKIHISEKIREKLRDIYESYGFEIADESNDEYSKRFQSLCNLYSDKGLYHKTSSLYNAITYYFRANSNVIFALIKDTNSCLYKEDFYNYKLQSQNVISKVELDCKNDINNYNEAKATEEKNKQKELELQQQKELELQKKKENDLKRGYTDNGIITNANYDTKSYNKTFGSNQQKESYLLEGENATSTTIDNYISNVLYDTLDNNRGIYNKDAIFVNPGNLTERRIRIGTELFGENFTNKKSNNHYEDEEELSIDKQKQKRDTYSNMPPEQRLKIVKQGLKNIGVPLDKLSDSDLMKDIVNKTTQ